MFSSDKCNLKSSNTGSKIRDLLRSSTNNITIVQNNEHENKLQLKSSNLYEFSKYMESIKN